MLRNYGALTGSLLLFVLIGVARIYGWLGAPLVAVPMKFIGWTVLPPLGMQVATGLVLILINVYLMARLQAKNALFANRTNLAQSLFLLLLCGTPFIFPLTEGLIGMTLVLIGICILLTTFQQERSVSEYMSAFMLFGTAVLLIPVWVWFLPFLFLGYGSIRSLGWRTFLSSLLGLVTPFWIAAGVLFLIDEMGHFRSLFMEMAYAKPFGYATVPSEQLRALLLVTVFALPSIISYPFSASRLKERTRVSYSFLIILCFGALLVCLIMPTRLASLYGLLACLCSLLLTRMLLAVSSHSRWIYLLVTVVMLILYITLPLWTDSSIF